MKKLNKLIFFGNERLATAVSTKAPTLTGLVAAGYEIEAVLAGHSDSISRQKRALEIGPIAHSYGIPVILPGKKPDLVAKLKNHPAEAAILVAFGQLIPREVIELFPRGIINIHPSLLPQLRGSTPIETAILDGLGETGVSLMKITPKMDAGPLYAQQKISLSGHETKFELAQKLNQAGAKLLIDHLPDILAGSLEAKAQDEAAASYSHQLSKEDGAVDFNKPAEVLEREVRAYLGWPKSRATLNGHDLIITKARIAAGSDDGQLVIECNPGWLEILELTGPSGRTMTGADFLRGYQK